MVTADIRKAICDAEMPADLADAIRASYKELGEKVGEKDPFVAVRSSATAEDLPDASFAGQQDTYLNVKGADMVIQKVKECYASTFTDRATYYRTKQGFDHLSVALSAAIQMMVFSKAAGVMFTVDLVTGDDSTITIEGAWGLGEYVVQGTVTPDNFRVRKDDLAITSKMINTKPIKLVRKATGDVEELPVPEDEQKQPALTDDQVRELASYAKAIEKHYGCYMDMEWGVDERTNKIWLLQARPETVWSKKNKEKKNQTETAGLGVETTTDRVTVVKGLPASPGAAFGKAHVILDPSKIEEFKDGEILVTTMTAPDWVPAMKKAKAIVTDAGGMTCHASIVSRELGIPCIVGTKSRSTEATVSVKDGQMITVDATNGIVYDGVVGDIVKPKEEQAGGTTTVIAQESVPVTGTKVYMNLGNPDLAENMENFLAMALDSCGKNLSGRPSFMNIRCISLKLVILNALLTSSPMACARFARLWLRVLSHFGSVTLSPANIVTSKAAINMNRRKAVLFSAGVVHPVTTIRNILKPSNLKFRLSVRSAKNLAIRI